MVNSNSSDISDMNNYFQGLHVKLMRIELSLEWDTLNDDIWVR